MGVAETIYRHAPLAAQNAMVTAFGWRWHRLRFGGDYQRLARGFLERDRYSEVEFHRYLTQQLRTVLALALQRVPYYREAWRGTLTTSQIERFELADLVHLPPLEKHTVRERPRDLLVDGRPQRQHRVVHTSGSTGTPLQIYTLPGEFQSALAVRQVRACRPAGVDYLQPRATFSGRLVVPEADSSGPFHRYNAVEQQVYFSAFHLAPRTAPTYLEALRRHRTVWMTGYANSIYQLAALALCEGMRPGRDIPELRAVITTSEKLTEAMRKTIERAFTTRVHEEYASVENAYFVCENEHQQKLVSEDLGLLECVDDTARPVPTGEPGEVLATSLLRSGQLFVRFRTSDVARFSAEKARCGRPLPVLAEVIGRQEDTVYGPDGRRMVRFHGIFVDQPHVREGQIVQESLRHVRARVVPTPEFGDDDVHDIETRLRQRLSDGMLITVEQVPAIERTRAGKFQAVISRLSAEERASLGSLGGSSAPQSAGNASGTTPVV